MSAKNSHRLILQRPYDIDLEQQLLGYLLLCNEELDKLIGKLEPEHFADPVHQRIYDAVVTAVQAGQTASAFTLKNEFEDDRALKPIGGASYLAVLSGQARHCADPLAWAKIIKGMAFRRNLIQAAREVQDMAQNASVDFGPEKVAEEAERMMLEATSWASPTRIDRFRAVGDVARDVLSQITGPKGEPSVLFGLHGLDSAVGGMRAKELIIVGARPGMGKTAFAAHVARMAARQGHGVGFFSMEMSAPAVTLRLVTAEAYDNGISVAYEAARRSQLTSDEQEALFRAEVDLAQLPLRIHEGRGLTPAGIALAARRLQTEMAATPNPLGLIIIDHLQKIRPDRDCRGNKVAEMTEISDALQKMAGALSVPVVALSQLNRSVEARGGEKRPELSDLRESGSIEQDADVVLMLYREAYYLKKSEPAPTDPAYNDWYAKWLGSRHKLDIHIAKQRNGPEGRCTVHFDAPSSAIRG